MFTLFFCSHFFWVFTFLVFIQDHLSILTITHNYMFFFKLIYILETCALSPLFNLAMLHSDISANESFKKDKFLGTALNRYRIFSTSLNFTTILHLQFERLLPCLQPTVASCLACGIVCLLPAFQMIALHSGKPAFSLQPVIGFH